MFQKDKGKESKHDKGTNLNLVQGRRFSNRWNELNTKGKICVMPVLSLRTTLNQKREVSDSKGSCIMT
jgi:hypothetical protein